MHKVPVLCFFATLALLVTLPAIGGLFTGNRTLRGTSEPTQQQLLGYQPPLPPARVFVESEECNSRGLEPSKLELEVLEALIAATNSELSRVQQRLEPQARRWAETCRSNGNYVLACGNRKDSVHGAIIVTHVESDGMVKDVVIRPGDCAELDVTVMDARAIVSSGNDRVRQFFASLDR